MNFRIFPSTINNEGNKVPLIRGWRELASNDPNQIAIWQNHFGEQLKMFGIPCGKNNGILVLDIDVKPNDNGWETIRNRNLPIPDTFFQNTPSGGTHLIFQFDPNRPLRNKVRFLPGLDIRSEDGWIAWWGKNADYTKQILPAPEWIYEHAKDTVESQVSHANVKLAPEISKAILESSLTAIREAPAGESNNVLNKEAFRIGQLVASGAFSKEFAAAELFKAAKERGKPDYEAKATIESGLSGGFKNPLTVPFNEPIPNFDIPPVPGANERWTPGYFTKEDLLNTSKLRKPQLFENWSTEDIAITTADGGTGKTTLKLYEAICLALGDRFLGFDCKQRGKTLFITGEDTDKKLGAMIGQILKQMGLLDNSPGNEEKVNTVLQSIVVKKDADLCLIAKDKQGFLVPNPDAMRKIQEAVQDIKPKMIVFDPIASFWGSESALNDMNKAVTKFMSWLVEISGACVEMINHMGKSSSANKDMSQFAGRGGSGLPSNSRVSRVMRGLLADEYLEMTGKDLGLDQTAILCNVNKFSDGSPLFNAPFIIIRDGYLFYRVTLSKIKVKELEDSMSDIERIFTFIRHEREAGRYPTEKVIEGTFQVNANPISIARVKRAVQLLQYSGHMAEKVMQIQNPDLTVKEKALIIVDQEGNEIYNNKQQ